MINCNPETVSTDYDTSDRLYFEPLSVEDVLEIIAKEQMRGKVLGVIVQFGGQTPLKLAKALEEAGVPILGTSPDAIDLAEDRDRFKTLIDRLGLRQPESGIAHSAEAARQAAHAIGYPVLIRPSYVLGGRAMEIVADDGQLDRYLARLSADLDRPTDLVVSRARPLLIDRYLSDATEVDVDCIADGKTAFVAGVMEHIEEAGIHSGDSACALPPHSLKPEIIAEVERQAVALASALDVVGLMNVQLAVKDNQVYILEVNPRASRTVPFVAKVIGTPVAGIAAQVMAGRPLASFGLEQRPLDHVAVKEAVFPFARFPGVDPVLGPEMRSTGEVMGIDRDYSIAFAKSQTGIGSELPLEGTLFVSVRDADKERIVAPVKVLADLGFKIIGTRGTKRLLEERGIPCAQVNKVLEGRPHIVDAMKNGNVQIVFNTTEGAKALADSKDIRRTALLHHIPCYTTLAGVLAVTNAIRALKADILKVAPLQSYVGRGG
jgi:carbamoyl-phosphate synthase large subunit